jgi:hypothetical protein
MAAAIMTDGLEVLVQLVMLAIDTMPWSISKSRPVASVTLTLVDGRPLTAPVSAGRSPPFVPSVEPCGLGSLAGKDEAVPASPSSCAT